MSERGEQAADRSRESASSDQRGERTPEEGRSGGGGLKEDFGAIKDEIAGTPQALEERAQKGVSEHPVLGEALDFRLLGGAAVVALVVGFLFSLLSHILGLLVFFVLFFGLWLGIAARRARD
jgi:hypothetical protein